MAFIHSFISHGVACAPAPQLLGAVAPTATHAHPAALPTSRRRLARAVAAVIRRHRAAAAAEPSKEARKERPARVARRRDVNDRVPEAHQRKDDAGRVGVGDGDGVRVDERVDAVDGRGDPGHEQGDEEEAGDFGVAEGGGPVGFDGGTVLLLPGVVAARVVREGRSRRGGDFDGVFRVGGAGVGGGGFGGDACAVGEGDVGAGFVLEGDAFEVGGHLVVRCFEGVVVVFEAEGAELVAFFEDFAAGHDVDCKGSDDADPMAISVKCANLKRAFASFCVPCWTVAHGDAQKVPFMG